MISYFKNLRGEIVSTVAVLHEKHVLFLGLSIVIELHDVAMMHLGVNGTLLTSEFLSQRIG